MQAIQRYRDQAGGALMIAVGLGAIIEGQTYSFGSLARMGPGFFPVVLGALLGLAGVEIAASAKPTQASREDTAYKADWRGWGCIALSWSFSSFWEGMADSYRRPLQSYLFRRWAIVEIAS